MSQPSNDPRLRETEAFDPENAEPVEIDAAETIDAGAPSAPAPESAAAMDAVEAVEVVETGGQEALVAETIEVHPGAPAAGETEHVAAKQPPVEEQMPAVIVCPECHAESEWQADQVWRTIRCPNCRVGLQMPARELGALDSTLLKIHGALVWLMSILCPPVSIVIGLAGLIGCRHWDARDKATTLLVCGSAFQIVWISLAYTLVGSAGSV